MPHEIHVSERRSFRGCRRRWDWAYRQGYIPETPIKALEFGVAYHKAMEVFYHPDSYTTTSPQEKIEAAVRAFIDECDAQRARYLEVFGLRELPFEVATDFDERVERGIGMLTYHGTYVHPQHDNWFRPVAVEIPFEVPIMDPDHPGSPLRCLNSPYCGQTHSNDRTSPDSIVVFCGRVDMIAQDIRYGGYFIWDHKTAASLTADDGFLQLDDQVASYCWALAILLQLDIRGFIYAETRKDFPRPPKELKRSSGGRAFSTAQNQATSIEVFLPYVMKHDRMAYDAGLYAPYIEFLRSAAATQYSQRFTIIKSEAELKNVGRNIALEACDMIDHRTRIYPSVGRYACSTCAFRQPCLGMFMDEDPEYLLETTFIKTDRRYWMDQPPSSEKRTK